MPIAENFRRRGKFEEVKFVFPNAPNIPITVVGIKGLASGILLTVAPELWDGDAWMVRHCTKT